MNHLTNLFTLLELTRAMPQYGYALSGISQNDQSNLAEHHYLVVFIAWQLAANVEKAGAKIDVTKVLEFALIHDLGELLGGDIAMPYARTNPEAKKKAKSFEAENQKYLANFFGDQKAHFQELSSEILDANSDECVIAKLADYIELTHYKLFLRMFSKADIELVTPKLKLMIDKLNDAVARKELRAFVERWKHEVGTKDISQILYETPAAA